MIRHAILGMLLGVVFALSAGLTTVAMNVPDTSPVLVSHNGDDNRDGRIDEDESGWVCSEMGNGVCAGEAEPDVQTFGDGSFRVSCPPYGDLIDRNDFLVCVAA